MNITNAGDFKLSADCTSVLSNPSSLPLCEFYFDLYSEKELKSGDDAHTWNNWISNGTVKYADRSTLLNGENVWKDNIMAASKMTNFPYWYVYMTLKFSISSLPKQVFRTASYVTDVTEFKAPEELKENKHISIEPCAEGIKITLKKLPGDEEWQEWTKVMEMSSEIGFNFYPYENSSLRPTDENPESECIYPLTENGKVYKFRLSSNLGGYSEEFVWCKAGGGIGEIFNHSKWMEIVPEVDNKEFAYKINGDLNSLVMDSDKTKLLTFGADIQLQAGDKEFKDSMWLCSHYYSILNEDASENINTVSAYQSISTMDKYAKYRLGNLTNYNTYFVVISALFNVKDNPVCFTTEGSATQVDWVGDRINFVQDSKPVDENNKWSVVYSCDEKAVDTLKVLTDDSLDLDKTAFELTSDFDNHEFELGLQYNFNMEDSFENGKEYEVSFLISRYELDDESGSVSTEPFDFRTVVGNCYEFGTISYGEEERKITLSLLQPVYQFKYNFTASEVEDQDTCFIRFYPFQAGKYAITGISIEEVE